MEVEHDQSTKLALGRHLSGNSPNVDHHLERDMKMPPLPEPDVFGGVLNGDGPIKHVDHSYTANQMRQYARDVLEMAAMVAKNYQKTYYESHGERIAKEIRAMKEQIK
jgi:hypothetical protein